MAARSVTITALDLGLEVVPSHAIRLSLEAFGAVRRGETLSVADVSDGEGVMVINETFVLELHEPSALRDEVLAAKQARQWARAAEKEPDVEQADAIAAAEALARVQQENALRLKGELAEAKREVQETREAAAAVQAM